jgi:hypothetical protein
MRRLAIEIQNTGANALTGFAIRRQIVPGGDWLPYLGGSDFNAAIPGAIIAVGTTNAPQSLGAGLSAWMDIDPGACESIQLQAQCGSSTTINILAAGQLIYHN